MYYQTINVFHLLMAIFIGWYAYYKMSNPVTEIENKYLSWSLLVLGIGLILFHMYQLTYSQIVNYPAWVNQMHVALGIFLAILGYLLYVNKMTLSSNFWLTVICVLVGMFVYHLYHIVNRYHRHNLIESEK